MNRLMIAAGFPVFANRFNQVLYDSAPMRERFSDAIADKSASDTDILYGRRRENDAVLFEDARKLVVGRLRTLKSALDTVCAKPYQQEVTKRGSR
jgi:hypothetical protein